MQSAVGNMNKPLLALGLMSGTSLDGIDAALVRTDGGTIVETGPHISVPYENGFRDLLRSVLGGVDQIEKVERALTQLHADVVLMLISQAGLKPDEVDLIGFHGHTVLHDPAQSRTWQIGDGAYLAKATGSMLSVTFAAMMSRRAGRAPLWCRYIISLLPLAWRPRWLC